jgi:diacylglycerol kinase family enzyme
MSPLQLLINPRSGGGCSDTDAERLSALFRKAGAEIQIHWAGVDGEMHSLAERLVTERVPVIVAAGGDGTVNTLASVLAGTDTALGVLPLGTLNHFARDLGIPVGLEAAVEVVTRGKRRAVDLGEVNGRFFVNNSSIGLYPAMVRQREKQRRQLGRGKWPAMVWAMHTVLRSHPFLDLTLELDGRKQHRRTPFVFIGNNGYQMEGFTIGLRERLDCGVLSVYLTRRLRRFGLISLALRALVGRLQQARDFEANTTRELRIDSRHKRLLVATDGEVVAMDMPLEYRVHPGALRVIAP